MTAAYQTLLEHVRTLSREYDKVIKDPQNSFSIFSIIAKAHDEVNVHSRFISEILSPKGAHNEGTAFLKLFLKQINRTSFEIESVLVRREHRNIDIYITNAQGQAIVIENKIYAEDQPRQLQRYYQIAQEEGYQDITLIYLTLDGSPPDKQSTGKLPDNITAGIVQLSYEDDIIPWIAACEFSTKHSILRETFHQYQLVIKQLLGKHPSEAYMNALQELLLQGDNLTLAADIKEALSEAQASIQLQFWRELEQRILEKGYRIAEMNRYSESIINRFYNTKSPIEYGIQIDLQEQPFHDEKLMFGILLWQGLYYSFRSWRDSAGRDPKFDCLYEKLSCEGGFSQRSVWTLAWKWRPEQPPINFRTLDGLADPASRQKAITSILIEIDDAIDIYRRILTNLPTANP